MWCLILNCGLIEGSMCIFLWILCFIGFFFVSNVNFLVYDIVIVELEN